jgi:hypothetical protein
MSKRSKIVGVGLMALLVVLQFVQPERNSAPVDMEGDLLSVVSPQEQIAALLRSACYDCHSNHTIYPWYDKISPVSWYIHTHVKKGKDDLNFSDYGSMDQADQIGLLVETCEVLEAGTMPLQSYMLIHKEARLSPEEKALICDWAEEEALKVMRE